MSWGATAYTPIISYNEPPFGFCERPNMPDYPVCTENPYIGAENIKREFKRVLQQRPSKGCLQENFVGQLVDSNVNWIFVLLVCLIIFFTFKSSCLQ
jgi:hypothetical protein